MFMATIIFSTKIGPSREACVLSKTEAGIHERVERVKAILKQNNLIFVGSIIEEIQDVVEYEDALDALGLTSGLDFISQNGKMFH